MLSVLLTTALINGQTSLKTSVEQYEKIDKLVEKQHYKEALDYLESKRKDAYGEKDRVLYWIDYALLSHYAGLDSVSLKYFSKAEIAMEELYTKSLSKAAGSLLINDNVLDYRGEDYEKIYVRMFRGLTYYKLGLFEDAIIEVKNMNEQLALLENRSKRMAEEMNKSKGVKKDFYVNKSEFNNSALARYLSMLVYLYEGKIDDAQIDKDKIHDAFVSQKHIYDFPEPNLEIYFNESDKVKLNFISFVGLSPIKYAWNMKIDTYTNGLGIYREENNKWKLNEKMDWPGMTSGLNIKFSLPKLKMRGTEVNKVDVVVNGRVMTELSPIESIENIAMETYKIREPIIYIKSITRSILKAIANESANKELDKTTGSGLFGDLTRTLTSEIVGLTENADLRISHYFPSLALIGVLELEEGSYDIQINYKDSYGRIIYSDFYQNQEVRKGSGKNLIESIYLK